MKEKEKKEKTISFLGEKEEKFEGREKFNREIKKVENF